MTAGYPSKAEISRALQAAHGLGLPIERFEVGPRGQIRVFLGSTAHAPKDPFDEWMASRATPSSGPG
jgi:hypothetical protein